MHGRLDRWTHRQSTSKIDVGCSIPIGRSIFDIADFIVLQFFVKWGGSCQLMMFSCQVLACFRSPLSVSLRLLRLSALLLFLRANFFHLRRTGTVNPFVLDFSSNQTGLWSILEHTAPFPSRLISYSRIDLPQTSRFGIFRTWDLQWIAFSLLISTDSFLLFFFLILGNGFVEKTLVRCPRFAICLKAWVLLVVDHILSMRLILRKIWRFCDLMLHFTLACVLFF
jgi:hypothetical protein